MAGSDKAECGFLILLSFPRQAGCRSSSSQYIYSPFTLYIHPPCRQQVAPEILRSTPTGLETPTFLAFHHNISQQHLTPVSSPIHYYSVLQYNFKMPADSLRDMARRVAARNAHKINDVGNMPYSLVRPILMKIESPEKLVSPRQHPTPAPSSFPHILTATSTKSS